MQTSHNGRPLRDFVSYLKTEHAHEVHVDARFSADGTVTFFEQDAWDTRCYPFTPCQIEREFAESVRGLQQNGIQPHLDLDHEVMEEAAVAWLTEPDSVAEGIAMIAEALPQLSLSQMNGEHTLELFANAVRQGRELAQKKDASRETIAAAAANGAHIDKQIDHWRLTVEALIIASRRDAAAELGESDKVA